MITCVLSRNSKSAGNNFSRLGKRYTCRGLSPKGVYRKEATKVLMVLQIFRKDFGASQAPCGLDNRSVPIRNTKLPMGRKCGKHEIERHLLDGKAGPRGNQSNGDLRVDSRSTRPRGLGVKFLKDLNGKSKIRSQQY